MHLLKKSHSILFLLVLVLISGCVSLPSKEGVFRLGGTEYISLVNLCNTYAIKWEWDNLTQTVSLKKEKSEARILVDSPVVFINGKLEVVNLKPRYYRGTLVVPVAFRSQILDKYFPIKIEKKISLYPNKFNIKTIVIDSGHGGKDPGAVSKTELYEKDINLDIARRLKRLLEGQGIQVIMTRDSDNFISLERRVDIANQAKADFFVSIHVNANRSRVTTGLEVYYCLQQPDDILRRASATYDAPRFSNSCGAVSQDLKATLWDMMFVENQAESIQLAKDVFASTSKELHANSNGLKSANYFVLKNTRIPSILVEVGYISNSNEETKLRKSQYRQDIAGALAKAILG